ncbi:MAG: MFS transporter, partial [Trueperaceae bacterium]
MPASPPPTRHSRTIDRTPFPYAWVVLMASLVTMVATIPGQTVGVSVFLDAIIDDLGVSRSTVSLLYTIGTLAGSLALPFVGRFIDGRGPRLAVGVIATLFAGACLYMSFVEGLWMLAIGFVLIRMLGQGSLSLVSQHVVNLWFVQRRGMAISLMMVGMAVATALVPSLLDGLVGSAGWRGGYAWLALVVAVVAIPAGIAFFRDRPEAYGERPDGHRAGTKDVPPLDEAAMTLAQARRTSAFWLVVAGDAATSALGTGLIFHHFDILGQSGIDRATAAAAFVPIGLVTAVGTFAGGVMLDRFPPRFALSGCLAFLVAA